MKKIWISILAMSVMALAFLAGCSGKQSAATSDNTDVSSAEVSSLPQEANFASS